MNPICAALSVYVLRNLSNLRFFYGGGGFYIDVGCADLLVSGKVALRSGSGASIARLDRDVVVLQSGERLLADLLVFATGYSSMH
jgi:putative flavoprotein involved in K+ transport